MAELLAVSARAGFRPNRVNLAGFLAEQRWPLTIMVGGHARSVVRGLRLVADDLEWSHGDGPEVHGPAETWLRLLGGRKVGPDELTGPGAATLYARLQPSAA